MKEFVFWLCLGVCVVCLVGESYAGGGLWLGGRGGGVLAGGGREVLAGGWLLGREGRLEMLKSERRSGGEYGVLRQSQSASDTFLRETAPDARGGVFILGLMWAFDAICITVNSLLLSEKIKGHIIYPIFVMGVGLYGGLAALVGTGFLLPGMHIGWRLAIFVIHAMTVLWSSITGFKYSKRERRRRLRKKYRRPPLAWSIVPWFGGSRPEEVQAGLAWSARF